MGARELGEVRSGAGLGRDPGGPGFHRRFLLVIHPQQDVARPHLSRSLVLREVGVVVVADFLVGQRQAVEDGRLIDEQEAEAPLLGHFVVRRLLGEEQ